MLFLYCSNNKIAVYLSIFFIQEKFIMNDAGKMFFVFKEIYDNYMGQYGEYDCSRATNTKQRFNE